MSSGRNPLTRYRRLVLDMHVCDNAPGLLSRFDADQIADQLVTGRVNYATVYAQSCTGHCYWPTKVGRAHSQTQRQDLFGSLVEALRGRDIFASAYYSLVFNNTVGDVPEWRVRSRPDAGFADDYARRRCGLCCPNNDGYVSQVEAELTELLTAYEMDGLFLDMAFWRPPCYCPHCADRLRTEEGSELPTVVNWTDAEWCQYQTVRERWNAEFQAEMTRMAKRLRPDMTVVHNAAGILHGWPLAVGLETVDASDFLAGDFYGDRVEQALVGRLLASASPSQPAEMMTTRCLPGPNEHVQTKDEDSLARTAAAAVATGAAASVIDAINPDGTVEPDFYRMLGRIYEPIAELEPDLGGDVVADVALYFSDTSKMSFRDGGRLGSDALVAPDTMPHVRALRGASNKLQRGQIPYAVVSRRDIDRLSDYRVVVLPDLLRMTNDECEAIRRYVAGGGRIYASQLTSLHSTTGERYDDFALSDVFGCHHAGADDHAVVYVRPAGSGATNTLTRSIDPQRYLTVRTASDPMHELPRLRCAPKTTPVAFRTVSMFPEQGSVVDGRYISLHSSPPWQDTDEILAVSHRYGHGHVIYSGAAIEAIDAPAAERFWQACITMLADNPWTVEVDTHPCVWTGVFHQRARRRVLLLFANHPSLEPGLPVPSVRFTLLPIDGVGYRRLVELPSGDDLEAVLGPDGSIAGELVNLSTLHAVAADY